MKLLQIYNDYRSACGGEAGVVRMTADIIEKHGGTSLLMSRTSKGVDRSFLSKVRAGFSSMYSPSARRHAARLIAKERPDVVHVHNIYPLFSPSVLIACRQAGVPVVMTNHNYLLTCPIVSHLRQGQVCEKCLTHGEHWCMLRNCRQNMAESMVYAARAVLARQLRLFKELVTVHIVLSEFARQKLLEAGFEDERIVVLPNMVEAVLEPRAIPRGEYIAFSGRIAPEKGVDVLLAAAARLPTVPVRLAGSGPALQEMTESPGECDFCRTARSRANGCVLSSRAISGHPEPVVRGMPACRFRGDGPRATCRRIPDRWVARVDRRRCDRISL